MSRKSPRRIIISLISVLVVAILGAVVLSIILNGLSGTYTDTIELHQQEYCGQICDTVSMMYESGCTDEEVAGYMEEHIEASGSRWAFLYNNNKIIFVKNMSVTKQMEGRTGDSLMSELIAQNVIITTESFNNKYHYIVGIVSDREQLLYTGGISEFQIYIMLLFAVIILFATGAVVALAGVWGKSDSKLDDVKQELRQRNEDFEKMQNLSADELEMSSLKSLTSENGRYKQYKFKFYLNARHAIYINGVLGTTHPHTWEIIINVIKKRNGFIEFNKLEKKIEQFMSIYQDKMLNDVPPFDIVNPTLENCCDYFKERISDILEQDGWVLLMIEMSETPSRSYVISMIDEEDVEQDDIETMMKIRQGEQGEEQSENKL